MTTTGQNMKPQIEGLATLLVLDDETRKLHSLREFGFFTTNETHRLIPYHTAWLWKKAYVGQPELINQSGTAEIDASGPLSQWIIKKIRQLSDSPKSREVFQSHVSAGEPGEVPVPQEFAGVLPENFLWSPLFGSDETLQGGLILFREEAFTEQEVRMFRWLLASYQYTWVVLTEHKKSRSLKRLKEKKLLWLVVIAVIAVMFYPVHLSVLGNATVAPLDPVLINAPMQGVIQSFAVSPGDHVKAGAILFSLDKTDLESDERVSRREMELTQAKLRTAVQGSFVEGDNSTETQSANQSEIPILKSQLDIDKAHILYTQEMLKKADVRTPINGIAVFDSRDDWLGQPVQTGERIMVIANPRRVQVKIDVPVANAIRIERGFAGEFFVHGQLNPLQLRVKNVGYNARLTASKILAYPVEAEFIDSKAIPQLGAEGTAKIYGDQVPLIYYLFRQPLQVIRQKLGI